MNICVEVMDACLTHEPRVLSADWIRLDEQHTGVQIELGESGYLSANQFAGHRIVVNVFRER